MNSVCLIGTLARRPTVRFEGAGVQTCTFTLAVPETTREGKAWVLYVPCTSYGKSAEAASLLSAEDLVSVQGRLTWHKHKAKCGQEHSTVVVSIRDVVVLVPAPPSQGTPNGSPWVGWGQAPDTAKATPA